ncbi:MAG: hypothetical protein COV45_06100 [Deltaproteobacteria bacterium CG11_big_fil_rev_8_21_14_0_20_47_16]|nr:MAG: hypothetical protein COV45_06100 [Deltaproteobacteria bacterium CG11_big_fil_rev_8_21_14_0_20_47_16]
MKLLLSALVVIFTSHTASAEVSKYTSKYTRLTKCQAINTGEEDGQNDSYLEKCEGLNGYNVYIESGDTRSWLVLKNNTTEIDLQGTGEGDVYFPIVGGDKLEWRYRTLNGREELVALILRIAGNEREAYEKGISKSTSFLYVFRIHGDKYCLLDKAKTNDLAHRFSDNPNLKCKAYYK